MRTSLLQRMHVDVPQGEGGGITRCGIAPRTEEPDPSVPVSDPIVREGDERDRFREASRVRRRHGPSTALVQGFQASAIAFAYEMPEHQDLQFLGTVAKDHDRFHVRVLRTLPWTVVRTLPPTRGGWSSVDDETNVEVIVIRCHRRRCRRRRRSRRTGSNEEARGILHARNVRGILPKVP